MKNLEEVLRHEAQKLVQTRTGNGTTIGTKWKDSELIGILTNVVEKARKERGNSRTMSNSISYSVRISSYNGEGGHHFVMWVIKFKAYLASQSLALILSSIFKDSVPDGETAILDLDLADDKKKQKGFDMNLKGKIAYRGA